VNASLLKFRQRETWLGKTGEFLAIDAERADFAGFIGISTKSASGKRLPSKTLPVK
jgi:hypothetical protein